MLAPPRLLAAAILGVITLVAGGLDAQEHARSCWPKPEDPEVQATDKGAAICFAGRLRSLDQTLDLMSQNLFPAFFEDNRPVDVFLYGPLPTAPELAGLGLLLKTGVVRTFKFDDEAEVDNEFLRTHSEELRVAKRLGGNWLAHGKTNRRGVQTATGIFQMLGHRQCLEMIMEREANLGHRYRHVALSRTDLQWLYPHPSLEFLRGRNFAWVPDTYEDDWGGVYDKHFVLPRSAVEHVFGTWNLLRSGCAYELLLSTLGREALRNNATNTERWLAVRLLTAAGTLSEPGIRVGRFPAVAYTTCEYGRVVGRTDARVAEDKLEPFLCSKEDDARYPLEHAAAKRFAACLSSAGGWTETAVRRCYCPQGVDFDSEDLFIGEAFPFRFELCRRQRGAD